MPRGNQYTAYNLPPEPAPVETICYQVEIPNSAYWRELWISHLSNLSYWYNYRRDTEKTGAYTANVWRAVLNGGGFDTCGTGIIRVEPVEVLPKGFYEIGCGCYLIDNRKMQATINILERCENFDRLPAIS